MCVKFRGSPWISVVSLVANLKHQISCAKFTTHKIPSLYIIRAHCVLDLDQWSSGCAGKTMVNTAQIGFGHSNASWSTAASSAAGASGNNRPRRQNVQCTLRCGGPGIDIGRSEKEERKWRRERGSCQAAPHTNRPADTHWLRSTLRTQPCEGFEVIRAGAPHSPSCQRGALKLSQQQPLGLAAC